MQTQNKFFHCLPEFLFLKLYRSSSPQEIYERTKKRNEKWWIYYNYHNVVESICWIYFIVDDRYHESFLINHTRFNGRRQSISTNTDRIMVTQ